MAGQEVIPEEDDMRLLELLRAQIKYRAARQYAHAARQAAGGTDGAAFQDRAYQVMRLVLHPGFCSRAAACCKRLPYRHHLQHHTGLCLLQ